MKRINAIMLILFLLAAVFPGCGQTVSNDKINIVCTIFPQYDWARRIIAGNEDEIELTLLLKNKIDLHSYQASFEDIAKISVCDIFIYVGGESDDWVGDALNEAINKDMKTINLLEILGAAAKEEETKEGMEPEEEEEDEIAYDEHVWLSLKNAELFCSAITEVISALDVENAELYQNNLAAYNQKLIKLDSDYRSAVDAAPVKTLLFGDRFPFRYLVDDYGLDYHAAFAGCSAETEASFNTIIWLADKTDELELKNLMVTESSDRLIAKKIIENTKNKNQKILMLDSMQSVTSTDLKNGATYLSIMENNLSVLKEALS